MNPASQRLLFRQGIASFWGMAAMGILVGGGATAIQVSNGETLASALVLGVPVAVGIAVVAWLISWYNTRSSVATLYVDGFMLSGRRMTPLGAGSAFSMPIPPPGQWRYELIRRSQARKSITFEFTHDDEAFRLPCYTAAVVDLDGLRALVPAIVSAAVVASERSLISKGVS